MRFLAPENWHLLLIDDCKRTADVRRRSIIKSEFGNLMIIPRERKLVRMYVQVSSELANNYWANGGDSEVIMKAVRKIMQPYRFDTSRIEWSTIYAVSERSNSTPPRRKKTVANSNAKPRLVTDIAENYPGTIESSSPATPSTRIPPKLGKE